MRARRLIGTFWLGFCCFSTMAPAGGAVPRCAASATGTLQGEAIGVHLDASMPRAAAERALARWTACERSSTGFPRLTLDAPAPIEVWVRYVRGNSQSERCAFFARREIVLFGAALDRAGKPYPCSPAEVLLAHELGHVLGLADAPRGGACALAIMAQDDPRFARLRAVQPEECAAVDRRWRTAVERSEVLAARAFAPGPFAALAEALSMLGANAREPGTGHSAPR